MIFALINLIYWILIILLVARAIFSWVRVDPYDPTWGKVQQLVMQLTEPMLQPIRELLRKILPDMGMIDFSPLILILGLGFLRRLLFSLL